MQYVMSDIHGAYARFLRMLKKIHFWEDDIIGDIPSRGDETFLLLDYVMKTPNIVHIKGNHELFLQAYLEDDLRMRLLYASFGGAKVIEELKNLSAKEKETYHAYLKTLPLYKKIKVNDREYILTHSGFMADEPAVIKEDGTVDIESSIIKWCEKSEYDYLISNDIHYIPASIKYPLMIVGHYPTEYLGCEGICFDGRYIDIDNGVNVIRGKKLACLRLEDMQEFYV